MSEQQQRINDTGDCIFCESLADFPAACETCGSPLVATKIKVTIGDETATYTWDACENTWKIDGQNPGMPETISGLN